VLPRYRTAVFRESRPANFVAVILDKKLSHRGKRGAVQTLAA
jgi:hypothetical protein